MFGSRSSRSRISPGASSLARAAASSIASGRPSRRRQTLRDVRCAAGVELEAGIDRLRPSCEEPHGIGLDERLERKAGIGSLERRHRILALRRQPQRRAARGQDPETRGSGEQVADEGRGREDLLEVVQHEQHAALAEVLDHAFGQVPLALADVERLRDRGHEQLRVRDRREADEQGAVAELGLERVRDRESQPRLARPSGTGERDEPRALVAEKRADRGELEPAADQRRGGHRQRPSRPGGRFGGGEARVLAEDCALQLLQDRARIEAEILGEDFARRAVHLERIRLAVAAVEREHPLLEEPLAIRVLCGDRFELGDDGVVAAAGELGVVAKLERAEPQLLEALGLGRAPDLLRQVGERRPAPDRERLAQVVGRVVGAASLESRPAAIEGALEAVEVELVLADDDPVAAAGRLDPLGPERAAQPVHIDLQRLDGGCGRCLPPEPVDELLGRDHAPPVDEQQREQAALFRRSERGRLVVEQCLNRPQNAELHGLPLVP